MIKRINGLTGLAAAVTLFVISFCFALSRGVWDINMHKLLLTTGLVVIAASVLINLWLKHWDSLSVDNNSVETRHVVTLVTISFATALLAAELAIAISKWSLPLPIVAFMAGISSIVAMIGLVPIAMAYDEVFTTRRMMFTTSLVVIGVATNALVIPAISCYIYGILLLPLLFQKSRA